MDIKIHKQSALVDALALATLRRRLRGELLTDEHPAYDRARHLVNGRFDRHPALIARVHNAQDVAYAVAFAREQGLEIAVRSGGHSIPGHSSGDAVMLIDLSQMKRIAVSADRRSAEVEPGVTNGELVLALDAQGLATTTGTCATVGMGGSTLGGGIGWLMGRFGATVDNVLAFEVVTADGDIRIASATEHPELFWALRGGGGNFGIVTRITYRLYALGPVLGGLALFHLAAAPLALRVYRELTSAAPDELIAHAVMTTIPDFGPALMLQAVYSGTDIAEGERLLAGIRRLGPPPVDLIAPRSYADAYMMLTPPIPDGAGWYDSSYSLQHPSDAALDDLVRTAQERPSPLSSVVVHQIHGAATRVAPEATAFALREKHFSVANIGMWLEGSGEAETAWAQQAQARMAPYASKGVYVNFLNEASEREVRESYGVNYTRLAVIKATYDPDNIFRRNQNIRPARD